MSSSSGTDQDTKDGQQEKGKTPVSSPPPAVPAQKNCFLDGSEHLYELLIGVKHSVPRPRRMWDSPSPMATQDICDECWDRLQNSESAGN